MMNETYEKVLELFKIYQEEIKKVFDEKIATPRTFCCTSSKQTRNK